VCRAPRLAWMIKFETARFNLGRPCLDLTREVEYGPTGWAVRNFVNATGRSWKGPTAYPLRTQEWLGPGIGGGSDDGHSSVPDVWH
jgi:hypothetical protein